jgi:hypothetical protein
MDQKDNHKLDGQTQEENLPDKIHSKNWLGRLIVGQPTKKILPAAEPNRCRNSIFIPPTDRRKSVASW